MWSDLYTARVTLADAAMCMNLINGSLFSSNHRDFLYYNTTALHMPAWICSEGGC